ncbi:hypothetical protein J4558_24645 [Leptolyngbya sp. 15MV]|nr:hypothetical protein J4558_24645 [Leptolyngbya sp. 15MV]
MTGKEKSAAKSEASKKSVTKPAAAAKAPAARPATGAKGSSKPVASPAKVAAKPPTPPKAAAKAPEPTKPAAAPAPAASADKSGRKGITIVQPKPVKKPEKASTLQIPKFGAPLLKPGAKPKPIIESGPDAARKPLHIDDGSKPRKTPFDKKTLERFRQILVRKRAELIGDVSAMESEALKGLARRKACRARFQQPHQGQGARHEILAVLTKDSFH